MKRYFLSLIALYAGLLGGYLSPLTGITVFFILALAAFLLFQRGIKLHVDTLVYLSFSLFCLASCLWAIDKWGAMLFSSSVLAGALLYMVLRSERDTQPSVLLALLLSGLMNAIVGLYQGLSGQATGFFYNRNPYAGFLAPLVIVSLGLYFSSKRKILSIPCSFLLFSVLLSGSRGGIYSMFLCIILVSIYFLKKKRWGAILQTLLITTFGLVSYLLFDYMRSYFEVPSEAVLGKRFGTERWGMFKAYPEIFVGSPILGYGMNSFAFLSDKVFSPSLNYFVHGQTHAHNIFFNILLELGILGFILFCLFLFLVLRGGGFGKRLFQSCALISFLLHNLFEYNFPAPSFQVLFLSLCAASVGEVGMKEIVVHRCLKRAFAYGTVLFFLFCCLLPFSGHLLFRASREVIARKGDIETGVKMLVCSNLLCYACSAVHGGTASFLASLYEVDPKANGALLALVDKYYADAMGWNRGDVGLYVEAAKFYSRTGRKRLAEECLLKIEKQSPFSLALKFEMASFYSALKDYRRAVEILSDLEGFYRTYAPSSEERADVLFALSDNLAKMKEVDKAETFSKMGKAITRALEKER